MRRVRSAFSTFNFYLYLFSRYPSSSTSLLLFRFFIHNLRLLCLLSLNLTVFVTLRTQTSLGPVLVSSILGLSK